MKSANRMFCWCRTALPVLDVWSRSRFDQFNKQAVWIDKANQFFIKPGTRSFRRHMLLLQALQPVASRVFWNCECHSIDLARATNSASHAWLRKKRQDGAGRAALIAEVKMISAGIIEIHRALDEAQSEQASIKIQIALRITRNRSNVMKSGNFVFHKARMRLRPYFLFGSAEAIISRA